MKRREFIVKGTLAASVLSLPWACENPSKVKKNWIWIGPKKNNSISDWESSFSKYKSFGIDAVILEVFMGRKAYYESEMLDSEGNMLEKAIEAAGKAGVELHAWMWTMPCMIPKILTDHPDWYNVNAKGQSSSTHPAYVDYYKFLCPSRPEPREFIRSRVAELAQKEGLNGVHLDYIRHPDAILPVDLWAKYDLVQDKVYPEFDYCYCEYCRQDFESKHGIDPLELEDPTSNKEWMQYRWDSVTDLVNDFLVPEAKNNGKLITAAVFPGPSLAKEMVRQNWGEWRLDAYMPMLYHSFYRENPEWVGKLTKEGVSTVAPAKLYSGLFVPGIKSEGEFETTLKESYQAGAAGVSLFGMKEEYWKTFKSTQ